MTVKRGPEGLLERGYRCRGRCRYGPVFWLFKGGFKVTSGTLECYRSNSGTHFDNSEIGSPVYAIPIVTCAADLERPSPEKLSSTRSKQSGVPICRGIDTCCLHKTGRIDGGRFRTAMIIETPKVTSLKIT